MKILRQVFIGYAVILLAMLLTSCTTEVTVNSVKIVENTIPTSINAKANIEEELGKIAIKVIKSDGSEEMINLTKDMLSTSDYDSLKEVGTHEITVLYEDFEVSVTLTIIETIYQVVFKNDNVILKSEDVVEGESATAPENPETYSTESTDYTFEKWDKDFTNVKEDMVVNAIFKKTPKKYTVKFLDSEGNLLSSSNVKYGDKAVAPESPVKASTKENTYTFIDWDTDFSCVKKDLVVRPCYYSSSRIYTVSFVNDDGTVLSTSEVPYGCGAMPPLTPSKEMTAAEVFDFKGWDKAYYNIESDTVIKAQYISTPRVYTVEFRSENGTLYQKDYVEYGKAAVYSNSIPTKPETEACTYTFNKWDKDYSNVTENMIVKSIFSETPKKYVIRFHGDPWAVIIKEEEVEYGKAAVGPEVLPTKEPTYNTAYTFKCWNKDLSMIKGNMDVYPEFSEKARTFKVEFFSEGTSLGVQEIEFDHDAVLPEIPSKEATDEHCYSFVSWDKGYKKIREDTVINAIYKEHNKILTVTLPSIYGFNFTLPEGKSEFAYGSDVTIGVERINPSCGIWYKDMNLIADEEGNTYTFTDSFTIKGIADDHHFAYIIGYELKYISFSFKYGNGELNSHMSFDEARKCYVIDISGVNSADTRDCEVIMEYYPVGEEESVKQIIKVKDGIGYLVDDENNGIIFDKIPTFSEGEKFHPYLSLNCYRVPTISIKGKHNRVGLDGYTFDLNEKQLSKYKSYSLILSSNGAEKTTLYKGFDGHYHVSYEQLSVLKNPYIELEKCVYSDDNIKVNIVTENRGTSNLIMGVDDILNITDYDSNESYFAGWASDNTFEKLIDSNLSLKPLLSYEDVKSINYDPITKEATLYRMASTEKGVYHITARFFVGDKMIDEFEAENCDLGYFFDYNYIDALDDESPMKEKELNVSLYGLSDGKCCLDFYLYDAYSVDVYVNGESKGTIYAVTIDSLIQKLSVFGSSGYFDKQLGELSNISTLTYNNVPEVIDFVDEEELEVTMHIKGKDPVVKTYRADDIVSYVESGVTVYGIFTDENYQNMVSDENGVSAQKLMIYGDKIDLYVVMKDSDVLPNGIYGTYCLDDLYFGIYEKAGLYNDKLIMDMNIPFDCFASEDTIYVRIGNSLVAKYDKETNTLKDIKGKTISKVLDKRLVYDEKDWTNILVDVIDGKLVKRVVVEKNNEVKVRYFHYYYEDKYLKICTDTELIKELNAVEVHVPFVTLYFDTNNKVNGMTLFESDVYLKNITMYSCHVNDYYVDELGNIVNPRDPELSQFRLGRDYLLLTTVYNEDMLKLQDKIFVCNEGEITYKLDFSKNYFIIQNGSSTTQNLIGFSIVRVNGEDEIHCFINNKEQLFTINDDLTITIDGKVYSEVQ